MTTKLRITILLALVACFALLVSGCSSDSDGGTTAPIVVTPPVEDTTAPTTPVNLGVYVNDDKVTLAWIENAEVDLASYNVYRSFYGTTEYTLVGSCDTARFVDTLTGRAILSVDYKVSALDVTGNESAQTTGVNAIVDLTEPIPVEWQPPVEDY
jgi:hypothetical protein